MEQTLYSKLNLISANTNEISVRILDIYKT